MQKISFIISLILCLSCLFAPAACAGETRVLVFIEEGEGFSLPENGLRILPGEDAVFTVEMDRGVILTETDYAGDYDMDVQNRTVTLTLRNILYPARVRLTVSTKYCTVRYDANGGAASSGETAVEKRYSLSTHPRPNTETGIFDRPGYTLACWNTRSDGQGERIGLGSRVTPVNGRAKLYAQWAKWSEEENFDWEENETVSLTGYRGQEETLVLPARINGKPVTRLAAGAFTGCKAKAVILPPSLETVEDGAFEDCEIQSLTLFDNIVSISDGAFVSCPRLETLYINASEAPFGYVYRKESVYADKVELLLKAQGQKKLVFYGGCSIWYNLDAIQAVRQFGEECRIINMGLNGTVSSAVQMQIMAHFLSEGDVLFHTPELSSRLQLMHSPDMGENDSSLWAGLENNYDLFSLVDLRTVGGVFSSLTHYLGLKDRRTDYQQFFSDDYRTPYMDAYGSIPFYRSATKKELGDKVRLDLSRVSGHALDNLAAYYSLLSAKGVKIYVSYACVNLDALPQEERGNAEAMDQAFRESIAAMDGPVLISRLSDYLYHQNDFYDTNYHLLSEPAKQNTARWMKDLSAYWKAEEEETP
ncbi:MAG: leucine-rich repeat protein [Clostridia bacterium]|nr:leucine-rich repeat protein [Clostridia bacterium]